MTMSTAAQGFSAFPPRPGRRGRSWWAREFVAAMEDATHDLNLLRRGRRFAGSGRVGPIAVSPGRIAAVADDPDGAFDVVVRIAAWDDAEWERFLDQVTAEAGHLAALLDGEVPRSLVRSADAADVALLPTIGDLESECDCPDIGDPCQHAAALCYQAAWLLDDDPFVLLLMRGRGRDELLAMLGRHEERPVPDGGIDGGIDGGGDDGPLTAAAAYAAPAVELPDVTAPVPRVPVPIALPAAPGLAAETLPALVVAAADRARVLLGVPPSM